MILMMIMGIYCMCVCIYLYICQVLCSTLNMHTLICSSRELSDVGSIIISSLQMRNMRQRRVE